VAFVLRGNRFRRDVGRLWRNGRSRGGFLGCRNSRFGRQRFGIGFLGYSLGFRLNVSGHWYDFGFLLRLGRRRNFGLGGVVRRNRAIEALNRLPDPAYGGRAIFELFHRGGTRQAVPYVDQPGRGPVGSQLCQPGFVAEAGRARNRYRYLWLTSCIRSLRHTDFRSALHPEIHFNLFVSFFCRWRY
jgi:hypothetical protein